MEIKKISPEQIVHVTNLIREFYCEGIDIQEYYLKKKYERVDNDFNTDQLFSDYSISPEHMNFVLEELSEKDFKHFTTHIATFPIESQIGRRLVIGVKETNTNKYVGFIRIASPVSSIKPRNDFFGESLKLDVVNKHIYNGQTIVPVQPFGYNYLGGKLLALICQSNEVREMYNRKYNTNVLLFETTSLYGSSKGSSMYDGLEPYILNIGVTESKNLLFPTDDVYGEIKNIFKSQYGKDEYNGNLTNPKQSSPKKREFDRIIQLIKLHLSGLDKKEFSEYLKTNVETKQQKRFYISKMGFDNIKEHLLYGDPLIEKNRQRFDLENIVSYWKNKSIKRFNKLNSTDTIKSDLEFYTKEVIQDGIKFKIIR